MKRLATLSFLALVGCATAPAPEHLVVRPYHDTSGLRRCILPVRLSEDPGEAVLTLWEHLRICVLVAADMADQLDRVND